ncbi:MAG: STAS domain-containing protein [Planctomycetes bacterium]|nr:STAS domain-containing protein [Planctomycetota bacterium]
MATQRLSEHIVLVTLPAEPGTGNDLEIVAHATHPGSEDDVIVDFSLAEVLPSATICNLIVLERMLSAAGRQLVLCSVSPKVKLAFRQVGLHKLFQFTEDEFAAVKSLNRSECPYP